jgi:hypothetical protein
MKYRPEINPEMIAVLKLSYVTEKTRKRDKEVHEYVYLGSVVETNGKIHKKTNKISGRASKCYHSAKIVLLNKETDTKCTITTYIYFKNILLHGAETWT